MSRCKEDLEVQI